MNLDTHFSEDDWARIGRDWGAWWAGELERPLVMIDGSDALGWANFGLFEVKKRLGLSRFTLFDLVNRPLPTLFPLDIPAEDVIDAYTQLMNTIRFFGDSFPRWWFNFGPGIAAGFLGGRVKPLPTTVWFDLPEPIDLHAFHPTYDPQNAWWRRVMDLTRLAVECWGSQATIGITDLGGNLDILASFRSMQKLLYDFIDVPEEIDRLVREINAVWLRYYDEQVALIQQCGRGTTPWAHIWSPGRCYMLQSDISYMISPAMFERFVLPDLEACCSALDHAFYHLDGKGEIPHLDMLLSIKNLHGIQWIPGDGAPPPEEWLPLLKRIRDAGKLVQLYVKPEGALKIVRALGGKGFALYIHQPMTPGSARDYLRKIMAECAGR